MSLMDKLIKNTNLDKATTLEKSTLFDMDMVSTDIPMLNVALSGRLDGGITSGLTVLAAPSKHFKTSFALLIASAYLREKPNAVLMYYDSEFGAPKEYFKSFDIDPERVLHCPISDIEDLTFDMVSQLEALTDEDDVIIVIDSIGNVASKKELGDALDKKSTVDMTRAKSLKSLFRMVTPYLTLKNIPMIAINHTYQEMTMYGKAKVSGGTGIYYSADTVWIIGRVQNKEKTGESDGYNFVINIEKSRYIQEKSKIPITLTKDGSIKRYSGLKDLAKEFGFIKGSGAWYQLVDITSGEVSEKKIRDRDIPLQYYEDLLNSEIFYNRVKEQYTLPHIKLCESIISEDNPPENLVG